MSIQSDIKTGISEAMRAKDAVRLTVLRGLLAAFVNEQVKNGLKPDVLIDDENALAVIRRLAKQRRDSISEFGKGGRTDLVEEETKELSVLEKFLPTMMSKEDIWVVVDRKKQELGVTDKSKAGILVGAVMKELKGKAEGTDVKDVVDKSFAE